MKAKSLTKHTIRESLIELIQGLLQEGIAGGRFCWHIARSLRIEEGRLMQFVDGDLDALSESQCLKLAAVTAA